MFRLEMLAAAHGDAILLECGRGSEVECRILIDGGTASSYGDGLRARMLAVPPSADGRRHLDLIVVTHVDGDHIEGIVKLFQDDELALAIGDVWFNEHAHLVAAAKMSTGTLAAAAGEFLGVLITDLQLPWNAAFGGGPVAVPDSPADADPVPLMEASIGRVVLTVLSPTSRRARRMAGEWSDAIEDAGFLPGNREAALREFRSRRWAAPPTLGESSPPKRDNAPANGSSIALLAEYGGRRVLLGADAHHDVLQAGLERWAAQHPEACDDDGRVLLDAYKVSHHGSGGNVSPGLLATMRTPLYLFSTNGAQFGHPDRAAVEMIVNRHPLPDSAVLAFNYHQPRQDTWDLHAERRYGADAIAVWTTEES